MPFMESVIGLEIHAQLKTATKLFCSCPTSVGSEPNSHICEVCSGQPGALPRLNARAVELAARAGLALGSKINEFSIFSRKNYFYPDLPNGFQISQLAPPICEGGGLTLPDSGDKFIRLNRIHLEDDAGKCLHDERRGLTLVDLNRAGTPLIEIVTEPDFRSPAEVVEFLKKLHAILVHLEVTEGRLEEGEFRCDVNISLRPEGSEALGIRSEIKNLNSFRHVSQAIEYEVLRQGGQYERSEPIIQETRLFDPARQETRALRSKEEAHDYRYFPQPDLPPVPVPPATLTRLKAELPRLPEEIMATLLSLGLTGEQAAVLQNRRGAVEYFEAARFFFDEPKRLAALMLELLLPAALREDIYPLEAKCTPKLLAALAELMADNTLSRRAAYDLFPEIFEQGADPKELAKLRGVLQISDARAIEALAVDLIKAHPDEAEKYRNGQEKILSFFVGRLMRQSQGAANPTLAGEVLVRLLKSQPE
jgi:aspartyl-tRNA(Asn)/glutamyl-tRNA(Gln) amidotransferase subunit B